MKVVDMAHVYQPVTRKDKISVAFIEKAGKFLMIAAGDSVFRFDEEACGKLIEDLEAVYDRETGEWND